MNQVVIMGRMVRNPELRQTQSGTPVTSFTLAVDRGYAGKDKERETDFIDCVAWRGVAEFVSKYFVRGQLTAVSGRLQIRDWTDKDGNKRRSAEVVADNVYFTGDRRGGGDNQDGRPPVGYAESQKAPQQSAYSDYGGFSALDNSDDPGDLPF